ncbi:MAG TPA: PepSY-associated TM helix domain-containing protein [Gammaproteobacteria bacterium]
MMRAANRGGAWRAWLDRPQTVPFRKALLTLHSWVALVLGVYIVVISVSGSAVVFRRELNVWLVPRTVAVAGERLSGGELHAAVQAAYAGHVVLEVREPQSVDRPVRVALERNGQRHERLFDPYARADLGSTFPPTLRVVEWLVDLHDNLLAGPSGRRVNGIGGLLVLALALSGAVLWWPGRGRWRQSLYVRAPSRTRRFAWHLHSALGFWCGALLVVWAATAAYFAFPEPVERFIDALDSNPDDFERPGEPLLLALVQLHFGRFGGLGVRIAWTLLGLVPALLFVTGFIMWRQRVAARGRRAAQAGASRGRNADQSA